MMMMYGLCADNNDGSYSTVGGWASMHPCLLNSAFPYMELNYYRAHSSVFLPLNNNCELIIPLSNTRCRSFIGFNRLLHEWATIGALTKWFLR